ncbi:hypothetical protein [Absidia glauca]|uniref:F-box/LRR-repeat protein 15/At3g58940/PEG3-like LRR domain-containing protein n=1 Tax=Absidia glauca TaxID=4829 RepID=A0A163UT35_ABSGL|nr:hypothetical protein [Absidia glauca]
MSYLTDASLEVLHMILYNVDQQSDLYQCALVNKSMYAATNPLLWREPTVFNRETFRESNIAACLLRSFRQARIHGFRATSLGQHIRTLYFRVDTLLQDLRQMINNVPLVDELIIHVITLKDKDMERIAIKCPQLKRLTLRYLMDAPDHFFEPLRHCTNLRELNIIDSIRLNYQLASLNHGQLEKLTLRPYVHTGDSFTWSIFGEVPTLNDLAIPTLTHLDMDSMTETYFQHYHSLSSPTLFPVLTDLRIAMPFYTATADDTVVSFFKAHPLIDTLTIQCMEIDPVIMISLAIDLVHLKRLTLIDNQHLPTFTMALPLVEKLSLRGCRMNVDSMVQMVMHFPSLHYIHVTNIIGLQSFGDGLPLDGLTIESRTHLTYLDLTSRDSVPDQLKEHLPRRMDGKLVQEDLEQIRKTAVGLLWIDQ